MHRMVNKTLKIFAWVSLAIFGFSPMVTGEIPIQGMPVPELIEFDYLMRNFMYNYDIKAGLLGIMRNGVIIYQRGFGWKDAGQTEHLRHDALMRIASCTKPFTAAAAQKLIADTNDLLAQNDFAFDLGQDKPGILKYDAFPDPEKYDQRYKDITVQHLYTHHGGWDRKRESGSKGDHTRKEIQIADAFKNEGVLTPYPPERKKTVRWIMGQPLDFDPGERRAYSNVGFLVLGLIVEQVSDYKENLVQYVRDTVLGPLDWVPVTELVQGHTFPGDRDPREPWYDCEPVVQNVFNLRDSNKQLIKVIESEGGWDHEARIGHGGMVSSTTIILYLAENYYINERQGSDQDYGKPTGGVRDNRVHFGNFCGTSSVMKQRSDGINFAVIINKQEDIREDHSLKEEIRDLIDALIEAGGITWPTQGVDGQWTDFSKAATGEGSFETPWNDLSLALNAIAEEGTLNIKPGSTNWTGTINQKIRIRAPLGTATIGKAP